MRILAGIYKGRPLVSPKGNKTRPTSSKMRGSIYNILQMQIQGADFLDLYAGSGAMGLEALSRGAKSATFVERDRDAVRCIRENLKSLGTQGIVIQADVMGALKKMRTPYDIIYIDPPYDYNIEPLLEIVSSHLKKDGVILLEQRRGRELQVDSLQLISKRFFGDSALYFLTKRTDCQKSP